KSRPPKWEPPRSSPWTVVEGGVSEVKKIRFQPFISGCPTSSEEQQFKITPKTDVRFKIPTQSHVLERTQPVSQSKLEKSSNEMGKIAPKQNLFSKLCKRRLAKLRIDPAIDGLKGFHDIVTTSELQTHSKAGSHPTSLTSDGRIKDAGRLNPEERMHMLKQAGQAEVVVLTMMFQDGATQLDHEQVSGLYPKSVFKIVCHRDMILCVLSRSKLVVCYKAKDFLRTVLLLYKQDLSWKRVAGCQIQDPRVSGWLLDPTDPSSCFKDLLNKHCKKPRATPSLSPDKVSQMALNYLIIMIFLLQLLQLQDLHPLPKIILEYRQVGYVNKVYSTFDLLVSLSLSDVCLIFTGKEEEVVTIHPRDMFIAREGWTFLAADFCQVELRLLAHFSSDPELLRIFTDPQADVFTMLASQWKVVGVDEVTPEDREHAKRIVYSVVYGAGRERLSGILGVNVEQASRFQDSFLQTYREVQAFIQRTIQQSHKQGYVVSLMGRRRLLPHISSPDWGIRMQAERQAVNFVVQGSAADLCKMAMITMFNLVSSSSSLSARLLAQLHDELLYEVEDSQVEQFAGIPWVSICDVTPSFPLCVSQVPLKVAVSIGKSWGSMSELHTPPSVS
uniref:Polymerase (DNA directed) nu n=1 Tax=Xiphophorus maculatus TaxID=8083 RepID=M3ZHR5_XIPMA